MKGAIFRRIIEKFKHKGFERAHIVLEKDEEEDEEDYLVKTIGAFGLWQAVVSVTISLSRIVSIWNMMSLTFLTPTVEFVCVEFIDNVPFQIKNYTCYENCSKYKYTSVVGRSIVEDFGLICERAWLASFAQFILMMGLLFGAPLFGWVSDRYGRRAALIQSTFLNAVFMIILPFSPNYFIFTSIRFVIGIATGGSSLISVVQVLEIIGRQHREMAGTCPLISDGLAEASLAGFAYFTSDWQGFTLSYGVTTCFICMLVSFVPESPRWLVSNGKVDEAIEVTTRAAITNKLDTSSIITEITKAVQDIKLKDSEYVEVRVSYVYFFQSKTLLAMTSSIFMIWLALGVCYYGIYQYVTIVGVDPYLSVAVMGLMQIPFCPVGISINKRFGRKNSTIGLALVMAITMLVLIFVPKGHCLGNVLGIAAFVCSNIAFDISYVYVSELYPTPLRNMAFGLTSGGAKIGAMFAPFAANLSPTWLPSLVFSIFPMIIVLCCLILHETKGQNLEDTIKK